MDMGFDHKAWQNGRPNTERAAPAFDWHGLRARFLAAQACRGEMGFERAAPPVAGSFDAGAAASLAGYTSGKPDINPIDLGECKAEQDNNQTTPAHPGPAIEGEDD